MGVMTVSPIAKAGFATAFLLIISAGCAGARSDDPSDGGQSGAGSPDAGDAGNPAPAAADGGPKDGGSALDSGVVERPWLDAGTCQGPPFTFEGSHVFVGYCDSDADCAYLEQDSYQFGCVDYEPAGHKTCRPVNSCVSDEDCDTDAGRRCQVDFTIGVTYMRCIDGCDEWGTDCGSPGFLGRMSCQTQSGQGPLQCVAVGCYFDEECSDFTPSWGSPRCQGDSDGPGICVTPCEP